MQIYAKKDYKEFLDLGREEVLLTDECTNSTMNGMGGISGSLELRRREQRKNLHSGTEKLLKAAYLKKGYFINRPINTINNKPYDPPAPPELSDDNISPSKELFSYEYLKNHLNCVSTIFSYADIKILGKIQSTGNDSKHQSSADTEFIKEASQVINKLVFFIESH